MALSKKRESPALRWAGRRRGFLCAGEYSFCKNSYKIASSNCKLQDFIIKREKLELLAVLPKRSIQISRGISTIKSGTALQLSGTVNPAIQSHNHRKPGIANPVPQSNNNCTPGTTNPAPQSHKPKLAFPRGCLKKAKSHGRNAPETLLSVHFRGIQS